jgi:hypothetical protein
VSGRPPNKMAGKKVPTPFFLDDAGLFRILLKVFEPVFEKMVFKKFLFTIEASG